MNFRIAVNDNYSQSLNVTQIITMTRGKMLRNIVKIQFLESFNNIEDYYHPSTIYYSIL